MCFKVLLVTFSLFLQVNFILGQRQWVPPTTTAAEMWNPYTWYWPYAIAAAEGYRDWFTNAQQITNQLYMQAYATNAFWWTGGGGSGTGGVPGTVGGATGAAGGAAGQATGTATGTAGQATGTAGQATGTAGQATGGATNNTNIPNTQPVPNMSQGGTGWG